MKTKILTDTTENIEQAAKIITAGGLVAFPTETVYGLGADALNAEAVAKIYAAKGRPSDNPMIVHISSKDDLQRLTEDDTEDIKILTEVFWPGPMTIIVNRRSQVPDVTTGGLDTVGVRMPDNPTALELIEKSGCPIAAPSANLSGKPSPTTAGHVIEDLDGRVDAIITSDDSKVGIESTVIDMTGKRPVILRPGIITKDHLEAELKKRVLLDPAVNSRPGTRGDLKPKSPGMKYTHYAPEAHMIIFEGSREKVEAAIDAERIERESLGEKVEVIIFDDREHKAAAHEFFKKLRKADREGADVILAAALTEEGVGFSVMNRMLKSAGYNIKKV